MMKKGALTAAVLFVLVVGILGAVLLYSGGSGTTGAVPIDRDRETICHMPGQITMNLPSSAVVAHFKKHASGENDFSGPCCPEKSDCQKPCDGEDCTKEKCDPNFECKTVESNQARCCFPVTTTTTVTSSTSSTVPPSSTTTVTVPSTTVTTTPSTTSTTTTPSTTVTTVPPSTTSTTQPCANPNSCFGDLDCCPGFSCGAGTCSS